MLEHPGQRTHREQVHVLVQERQPAAAVVRVREGRDGEDEPAQRGERRPRPARGERVLRGDLDVQPRPRVRDAREAPDDVARVRGVLEDVVAEHEVVPLSRGDVPVRDGDHASAGRYARDLVDNPSRRRELVEDELTPVSAVVEDAPDVVEAEVGRQEGPHVLRASRHLGVAAEAAVHLWGVAGLVLLALALVPGVAVPAVQRDNLRVVEPGVEEGELAGSAAEELRRRGRRARGRAQPRTRRRWWRSGRGPASRTPRMRRRIG